MSRRSRRKKLKRLAMLREQQKKEGKEEVPEKHEKPKKEKITGIGDFYNKKYKLLLLIPMLLLVFAILQIAVQTITTGDFVNKGVSLKGGITITVPTENDIDILDFKKELEKSLPDVDFSVRKLTRAGQQLGIVIDADIKDEKSSDATINIIKEKTGVDRKNFGIETMEPSLGKSFFKETFSAILIAFLFMAIVVFYYFRTFIPSIAVILAAFSDMVITLAIINLLGIKLSTAGIAAFLMLIGYSVDTDILLSTRVLKREEGTVFNRVVGAMKTGLTMNFTTIAAVTVALFVAQSEVIKQIMTIILIGLIVDIINTWIQNAGILRWYMEKKGHV